MVAPYLHLLPQCCWRHVPRISTEQIIIAPKGMKKKFWDRSSSRILRCNKIPNSQLTWKHMFDNTHLDSCSFFGKEYYRIEPNYINTEKPKVCSWTEEIGPDSLAPHCPASVARYIFDMYGALLEKSLL